MPGLLGLRTHEGTRNHLQEIRSQIVSVRPGEGWTQPSAGPSSDPGVGPLVPLCVVLMVWFGFHGTQYKVSTWPCFYPVVLG